MSDHIINLVTAIIFAVIPFVGSRTRATWSRWIFFTISGLLIFIAASGLALDSHWWEFSKHGQSVYKNWLHIIRGFILGCIFALIISGNLEGKKVLKDETAA